MNIKCIICNQTNIKCDVHTNVTKYSKVLISDFIKDIIGNINIHILKSTCICTSCYDAINKLDDLRQRYEEIRSELRKDLIDNNAEQIDSLKGMFKDSSENQVYGKPELYGHRMYGEDDICKAMNENKKQTNFIIPNQYDSTYSNKSVQYNYESKHTEEAKGDVDKININMLKRYPCTTCNKNFKALSELETHICVHETAKLFICEICGQAYKKKNSLDIHIGMHNGIHPFTCEYCNKSFTQKGALQRHIPIHTGETQYLCKICGKKFIHRTSLQIHEKTHTGEKQVKCKICNLGLLSSSHLKRHLKVHTGEKNHVCSICSKGFAEKYNLVSHQKLHENLVDNR